MNARARDSKQFRRTRLHELARGNVEQSGADLEHLAQLGGRELRHHGAASWQYLNQTFALEYPDGLADGPAAERKFVREFLLPDARARR